MVRATSTTRRITGQFIDDPRAFRLNAATFEA